MIFLDVNFGLSIPRTCMIVLMFDRVNTLDLLYFNFKFFNKYYLAEKKFGLNCLLGLHMQPILILGLALYIYTVTDTILVELAHLGP